MSFDPYSLSVVLAHIGFAVIGIRLLLIDARTHRLPNRIVLPALLALVLLVIADALVRSAAAGLLRAVAGMLLLGGFYLVLRAVSRGGVGGGDVKLSAVIGLLLGWHGWPALAVGSALAFVLGAVYALVLLVVKRAKRTTRIAFGPWMILGAAAGIALV